MALTEHLRGGPPIAPYFLKDIPMTDDPHDATWIPYNSKVVRCPVCEDDLETCNCGRFYNGVILFIVWTGIVALIVMIGLLVAFT